MATTVMRRLKTTRPGRSFRYHSRRLSDGIAGIHRRRDDRAVSLTFDDGPQPGSTDLILDLLAEERVQATFFCVGRNVRTHPELVRRMVAEGHSVGSHSFTHPSPFEIDRVALAAEYSAGRRAVEVVTGHATTLFRPPHGDLVSGSTWMLRRLRLHTWLWTIDPEDWRPDAQADRIVADVAAVRGGDVVLLHDWVEQPVAPQALDRSATIAALPAIIDDVRTKGLHFESLR